jgi:hypothetical protein
MLLKEKFVVFVVVARKLLAVTGSGIKNPLNQLLFQTTKPRTHFGPLALHAQEPNVKKKTNIAP